jgi:hypothetical protein
MKQKLLLTLGIIVLVTMGLATSPVVAENPTLQSISVNNWKPPVPYRTQRFLLVMGKEAVLDRETGLVWERSPSASECTWLSAQFHCINLVLGNRKGWRLPTIQELASLVDPTQSNPTLPIGHPFMNVLPYHYWSATTNADITSDEAWVVDFGDGEVFGYGKVRATFSFAWCVRGGQGVDPQ